MRSTRSALARGVIGGALAATTIVVFFFLVDLVLAQPFRTPAFMGSVLLGREALDASAGLIALYTLVHYLVFMALGVIVAWAIEKARTPASLLLGLVVGFLFFDLAFYAAVWLRGVDVAATLGWPSFLVGNLLAGVVLLLYLARTGPAPTRSWGDVVREHDTVREGVVAGLIGAAAVAIWFFAIDAVLGRLFFTPAALGSAMFEGASQVEAVRVTAGTVLGYTVVHVAAFLATGLVFSGLVTQAEENPSFLLALVLLFVTFETLVIGLVAIVASWLLEVIAWWGIAVGNIIAAAAMGWYLWRRHPRLSQQLEHAEEPWAADEREGVGSGKDHIAR